MSQVQEVTCLDSADNFSDHLPIFFHLSFQATLSVHGRDGPHASVSSHSSSESSRVDWCKVTAQHAQNLCSFLNDHLPPVPGDLVKCCDPGCDTHLQLLDSVCSAILDCVARGTDICLPRKETSRHHIPEWNARASSLRQSATLWPIIWSESGCPSSGVLFQIKKNAKNRYKYEVRRLWRQREHIAQEKLGEALSLSRHIDFWKAVRSINKAKKVSASTPPTVEGCTGDGDIAKAKSRYKYAVTSLKDHILSKKISSALISRRNRKKA